MATKTMLPGEFDFIPTPAPAKPALETGEDCGVRVTSHPAIKNAPLPADGPGSESFSNLAMISLVVFVPLYLSWKVGGGTKTALFFGLFTTVPLLVAFWSVSSSLSPRLNDKVKLPGRPVEYYLDFKSDADKARYHGRHRIPMQTFYDKYFDGEVDFKGDCLEVLEYRHDWASFRFTLEIFRFILFQFIPDVIMHSRAQDDTQIRDNYDRGNDFYGWFLGPRMIYTSGIISDVNREETLEEIQDNKLAIVCEKIGLKEGERMLDIGCGWATLAKYASLNYGAKVTGITAAHEGTAYGNDILRKAGIPEEQSNILCMDYRDIPEQKFDKITSIEMAEHVGIFKLTSFFRQCYDLLEDDGVLYIQVSGLRKAWQYEDFVWGLFMNKYIFPGADASTPLGPYVSCMESAGFEVKSVDTVGVHYSATLWKWYRNWLGNEDKVVAKYGPRLYRIWKFFLAWSTIASRQGTATCFQFTLVKNLNHVHRADGIATQFGLSGALASSRAAGKAVLKD